MSHLKTDAEIDFRSVRTAGTLDGSLSRSRRGVPTRWVSTLESQSNEQDIARHRPMLTP